MLTASLFDSRYRGGDMIWRNTRYNRHYVWNLLAGKEWPTGRSRQNIFSAGVRLTYQGGDRYSPIDETASRQVQEAVYLEQEAFSRQYPPSFVAHFTLGYKINRGTRAHEFALKMINATLSAEYPGHQYNVKTSRVDRNKEVMMIPNVSYKIEF
jgi:hypothetical protein